jgi:hypothetical protein
MTDGGTSWQECVGEQNGSITKWSRNGGGEERMEEGRGDREKDPIIPFKSTSPML